ncbi:hypothetical protein P5673_017479 [Acropora cervicornis]|uniref:Uncharacterized protein n=1 Tax=Acropora cervicornis TaxID=6130 RepID=A0AAD9V3L8_ACRCE|nr:hypothetical protein P5673_017479 [Acropora cervicornis]
MSVKEQKAVQKFSVDCPQVR